MTAIERTTSLTVGVVIAQEKTDHPWQEYRWRPVDVLIGKPELPLGHILLRDETRVHRYAGSFPVELHRKETAAYLVNLENDPPVIYVVLREAGGDDDSNTNAMAYLVETVTVSPFEAQDFLDSGEDVVEALPMPAPLIAWLELFIAEHHEEEQFIKRKRDRLDIRHEKFGQEPIDVVRERQRRQ